MSLQWAAPPDNAIMGGEKHTKWGEVAGVLRANPGKSAKVAEKPNRTTAAGLVNTISGGKRSEFDPAGAFGAAYAPNPNDPDRYDVFAWYGQLGSMNGSGHSAVADDGGVEIGFADDNPEP